MPRHWNHDGNRMTAEVVQIVIGVLDVGAAQVPVVE